MASCHLSSRAGGLGDGSMLHGTLLTRGEGDTPAQAETLDTKRSRVCKDEAEEKECRDKAVRSLLGDRDSVTPSRGHTDQKGAVQSHLCAALCTSPTH